MMQRTKTANTNPVMGSREWTLIILLSIIWGGSFFFIKLSVADLPPFTVVLLRVLLASIILLSIIYLSGRKMPTSPKIWGGFLIMGLLNNVIPFILIVWGETHIDSGLASILNATTPIFGVVLTHFMTDNERLTTNRVAGVIIGWIGVTVLIGIDAIESFGIASLGQIGILGASISYAFAAIYARQLKELKPIVVAAGMLTCSAVIMLPLSLLVDQPWRLSPGLISCVAVVALAVLCTSVAYLIYFRILASAGATNGMLVTFLIPINAIMLGDFILGERLEWNAFAGMLLIFIGLIAIDGRLIKRLRLSTSTK